MSGAASRRKGATGEREVLRLLGELLGEALERNLSQSRSSGSDCIGVKGFAIEVKRQERLNRQAWWRQAVDQASKENGEPMLLYRRSREKWRAFIHTSNGRYREGTLEDAASAICEKWLLWP